MVNILDKQNSVANQFLLEMRDAVVQQDSMRFRRNLERLGEIFAYEISKRLDYEEAEVDTPLGTAKVNKPVSDIVLAAILRAGLPLHQGMLHHFDRAESAFVSAFRKNHKDGSFEIKLEYVSCPNLDGKTLIVCDPMLATGSSMALALENLLQQGQPKAIFLVTAIAATQGLNHIRRLFPNASVWMGTLDQELTAKYYIVPGLGDAGDLSFGKKIEEI